MNIYSHQDEENFILSKTIKTWARSGFLTSYQQQLFNKELPVSFKKTNLFFRILLFCFTALFIFSLTGFFGWVFSLRDKTELGFLFFLFGIPSLTLADRLTKKLSLYRHGVEEALVVCGGGLICLSMIQFVDHFFNRGRPEEVACGLSLFIIGGWVYKKWGYLYAYAASVFGLCLFVAQFFSSDAAQRIFVVLIAGGTLFLNMKKEPALEFENQKYRNSLIQIGLLATLYFVVNLQIESFEHILNPGRSFSSIKNRHLALFYWASYGLTFLLPLWILWTGVKKRKRFWIDVGLITFILSLMTNKSYLGLKRYDWDPAILGVFLIGVAIGTLRWFDKGKNKTRHGFTSLNLLKPETHGMDAAQLAALAAASPDSPGGTESAPLGSGGSSGGAGASGSY